MVATLKIIVASSGVKKTVLTRHRECEFLVVQTHMSVAKCGVEANLSIVAVEIYNGSVAERLKATVLKTVGGSRPS